MGSTSTSRSSGQHSDGGNIAMRRLRRLRQEECIPSDEPLKADIQAATAADPHWHALATPAPSVDATIEPAAMEIPRVRDAMTPPAASSADPAAAEKPAGRGRGRGIGNGRGRARSPADPGTTLCANTAADTSGTDAAAEFTDAKESALVHDYVVLRHALDAESMGVPKAELLKWVVDCSRDFFVRDEASFELAWHELLKTWLSRERRKANQRRKKEVAEANARLGAAESLFGARWADMPGASARSAVQKEEQPSQSRKRGRGQGPALYSVLPEIKACSEAATADMTDGLCESYDQALAVRLALALGRSAPRAMAEVVPSTTFEAAADDDSKLAKRLALFVHPDKTKHPKAKEAFQRLRERAF